MATYQDIRGLRVKFLSADPSNIAGGEVWYNSTTDTLRSRVVTKAWSSAAPINTARRGLAGMGTQGATLGTGGYIGPTVSFNNDTEEYNGVGWSIGGNLGTARDMMAACGTQTAGLVAGGRNATTANAFSEEYNGATWTEGSNLNTARGGLGQNGAGTQTAGLAAGGFTGPSGTKTGATEEYNGASWTTSPGSMSTARSAGALFGIQTAAVFASGEAPPNSPAVEEYDGSTWTAGTVVPDASQEQSGFGIATDGVIAGGTEDEALVVGYDGTTWTALPSLATGRVGAGAAGSASAGIIFGGSGTPPLQKDDTEEFNSSISSITAGAWASGGALPGNRSSQGGTIGDATTQLGVSGQVTYPLFTNSTEEYASSVWTAGGVYPTTIRAAFGGGTVTAGWMTGGETSVPNGPALSATNTYNGTAWTAGTAYPNTTVQASGCGPQTAGLAWAGNTAWGTSPQTTTFEYDGPSWTAGGAFPQAMQAQGWAGTQTAALHVGGGPPEVFCATYNGTSWTAAPDMYRIVYGGSVAGTNTAALLFAFGSPPIPSGTNVISSGFDGTSWYTQPSLGTARESGLSRSGTATAAIGGGGYLGPPGARIANTEEFTGETTSAAIQTLTTS